MATSYETSYENFYSLAPLFPCQNQPNPLASKNVEENPSQSWGFPHFSPVNSFKMNIIAINHLG